MTGIKESPEWDGMDYKEISEYLEAGAEARRKVDAKQLIALGKEMHSRFEKGHKLILMGNGGSAADAQHIAAEFVGRFKKERRPLPAIALHTNSSAMTAIANDYSYDEVFSRQIDAFANRGDIVIGISTSGNSENVVRALERARDKGCFTVAMSGKSGGRMKNIVDMPILVESDDTPIIQEVHITIGHIISKIVEDMLE